MLKIREAIIVEGRYDKEKISAFVDAIIIETGGFRIFKDKQKVKYIKKLALERGIIILTDSDNAGYQIRNHLKSFLDDKYIKNAYIPQLKGKEKRKEKTSAQGLLGVEGMSQDVILQAIEKAGAGKEKKTDIVFTTKDLFNLGLTGSDNSKMKKADFLKKLNLPSYLSNKDLLKYMNQNPEKIEMLQLCHADYSKFCY